MEEVKRRGNENEGGKTESVGEREAARLLPLQTTQRNLTQNKLNEAVRKRNVK
jgi:hypothetical protein